MEESPVPVVPLLPLVKTNIDKSVHHDEELNKPYLKKDDVVCVYYYDARTSTLFKVPKEDDAINDKIYLNVISSKAKRQFDLNKEGIICMRSNKAYDMTRLSEQFTLRTSLSVNEEVFVQKDTHNKSWQRARVLEFMKDKHLARVELLTIDSQPRNANSIFEIPLERVAYLIPPYVILSKAFRVVCRLTIRCGQINFLSGRILDLAKKANRFRYLVFFEGGITSYVQRKDVAIIFDQARGCENFTSFQKEFMHYYFKSYPEVRLERFKIGDKAMIRMKMPNQNDELYIKTQGVVTKVDNKLVQFYNRHHNTHVWLFRGDYTRILSINDESKRTDEFRSHRHRPIRKVSSQQQNIIEVTIDDDLEDEEPLPDDVPVVIEKPIIEPDVELSETISPPSPVIPRSEIKRIPLDQYLPHDCSPDCLSSREKENLKWRGINFYIIPMLYGWRRLYEIMFDFSKRIFYLSPCGKKFYNIEKIFDYLQLTRSILQIDQFNLDRNFVIEESGVHMNKYLVYVNDISNDSEVQPVSLLNTIDKTQISNFQYLAKREFSPNIQIQLDTNFLVCCNCEDDCRNSKKCVCQQMTIQASSSIHDFAEFPIKNRILSQKIMGGIYECNSGCHCNKRKDQCVNRDVQLGLRNKLQVFKTLDKGWGVRTLHDIPKGSFICTYAGVVLDDAAAEEEGRKHGDTYLADLDLIETLEEAKSDLYGLPFSLDESEYSKHSNNARQLFGEQAPYAINGAIRGNIGRFLNHSCDPNCFAQNVFVDSHDLRFPHLAFYSLRHITAFSEITWDYSYEIDGVPHKRIDCNCRSNNCRGRLL